MKKFGFTRLSVLLVCCSVFIFPSNTFADADNDIRSGCSLFKKRYKSKSTTKGNDFLDLFSCNDSDSDCSSTWTECTSYDDGGKPKWCAYANAAVFSGGYEQVEMEAFDGCSAGLGISDFSKLLVTKDRKSGVSTKFNYFRSIDVDKRIYSITNGNGTLSVDKNYTGYAEIKFIVWLAQDDYVNQIEDTKMTNDKIIAQEYIRIRNNKVELSEGFKNNKAIVVEETDNSIVVRLIKFEYKYDIPENVDIDEEFVGRVSSFAEFDNERFLQEQLEKSENSQLFGVFPNPSTGQLTIESAFTKPGKLTVQLFDHTGKYLDTVYDGINEQNAIIIIQVDEVSSGLYYLVFNQDGMIETKKVVIVRDK